MNLNNEKNNPRLILSRICKDYLILELQRSFISSTIGPNVSFESNRVIEYELTVIVCSTEMNA
ncbi:hypothetical protein BpHYR1_053716 [Brachionus plicatilis]|uniref:Uncharacterized protein n=1 Tax=Brachionus plicatilis TaxID=10195 RepID=A0A3M7S290_BRAPC|nr:hypothetical protein BpHYR1_053716 [Brachionus plicatilis]